MRGHCLFVSQFTASHEALKCCLDACQAKPTVPWAERIKETAPPVQLDS